MRLAFLLLPLAAALALLPGVAGASAYRVVDGYRVYDGYPGLYWYGNYAHTRVAYTVPGYYSYGVYYPATTSYRYVYSHTYYPVTAATITYQTPNAQAALIALKKDMIAQQNFNETVKVLGLQGHPSIGNPLYSMYGGGYSGSLTLSTAGSQGSTVYGYGQQQALAPNLDLNVLFQQANRLAEKTQSLTAQATGDFHALVGQQAAGQTRVAEILARGRALAEVQNALNGQSTTKSSASLQFKSEPPPAPNGGPKEDQPPPMPAEKELQAKVPAQAGWAASAQKCLPCHGAKAEGGFKVADYPSMGRDQKLAVIGRLLSPSEAKRMPRAPDGSPGAKLSSEEIVAWLNQ